MWSSMLHTMLFIICALSMIPRCLDGLHSNQFILVEATGTRKYNKYRYIVMVQIFVTGNRSIQICSINTIDER